MAYSKPEVKHEGTVSGRVTTATSPETIAMQNGAGDPVTVTDLAIKCITALRLRVNTETNWHEFDAGDTFNFSGTPITQLVIETAGSQIDYKGGHS